MHSCRCLLDYKPREFDAECCNILANFAEMVVRDAERFAAMNNQNLDKEKHFLIRGIESSASGYMLCNPHESSWYAQRQEELPCASLGKGAFSGGCPAVEGGVFRRRKFLRVFHSLCKYIRSVCWRLAGRYST